jgi:hypothetical protein
MRQTFSDSQRTVRDPKGMEVEDDEGEVKQKFTEFTVRQVHAVCEVCCMRWYGFWANDLKVPDTARDAVKKKARHSTWQARRVREAKLRCGSAFPLRPLVGKLSPQERRIRKELLTLRKVNPKEEDVVAFLEWYTSMHGEVAPEHTDADGHRKSGVPTKLPPMSKISVYLDYVAYAAFRFPDQKIYKDRQFLRVWREREETRCITIAPLKGGFTQCDRCSEFHEKLRVTKNEVTRDRLMRQRRVHLYKMRTERALYYRHRQLARAFPDMYLSCIADGMDQRKTELPHMAVKSKTMDSILSKHGAVRQELMGVLVHGVGRFFYTANEDIASGSAYTIECLARTLQSVAESRADGKLPPKLFVQLDNCSGENKNKYVFAFFARLVELQLVQSVTTSFLLVGHTHEDIDQCFCVISKYLHYNNARSPREFQEGVLKAFAHETGDGSSTSIEHVWVLRDWKSLLEPIIDSQWSGSSLHHVFHFEHNTKAEVRAWTKVLWSRRTWHPAAQKYGGGCSRC